MTVAPSESAATANDELEEFTRIPLPAEFEVAFQRERGLLEFHEQLEREPRNPEWANFFETGLREFIARRPALANADVLSVECRSSACEILAIGYGDSAFRTWMAEMQQALGEWILEMPRDPEQEEMQGGWSCGGDDIASGITALHCMLRMNDPLVSEEDTSEGTSYDFLLAESPEAETNESGRIPVPQDMVMLLEGNEELAESHLRMEREARDASWSVFMENQISEYLPNAPGWENFNLVLVECRTTLCEIQALTTPDPENILNWIIEFPDFARETWQDLEMADVNGAELPSGELGVIWIFERRQTGL